VSREGISERILRAHLRELPLHRVLGRSIEGRILADIDFPRPMLDVGCGDGHFASVIFPQGVDAGIDPGLADAAEAGARHVYCLVATASSLSLPFPDGSFASVLSNCVLEHIPDLETTFAEVARVLRPGGLFVCTVIGDRFNELSIPGASWKRTGLGRLRQAYVKWFDRKARHFHFDSPARWQQRLEHAGLAVRRWRYYFSPEASRAAHRSHYWSLPHLLFRKLTGKWVPFPSLMDNRFFVRRLLKYVEEPEPAVGSCIAFVCEKQPPL
jgi:SAM-dependent methyltransferase